MEQRNLVIPETQERSARHGAEADHATYFIVQTYRCDFIGRDGRCIRRDVLNSPSLEAAIKACIALFPLPEFSGYAGFELWHGSNCVHKYDRHIGALGL